MVEAVYLDEQIVLSGYEMTLDYFGDVLERLDYFRIFICLGERDTYKGADIQSYSLWLDEDARAGDDSIGFKSLYSLVDSGAGYVTLSCDFKKRHSGVLYQE